MIDRIHHHAANRRLDAHPALAPGLADGHVFVLDVAELTDRSHAIHVHLAHFAGRQAYLRVFAFLGQKLRRAARRAHQLAAFARPHLDIVNHRAGRNILQRQGVPGNDVGLGARQDLVAHF